ncbi:MAG: DUF4153 domain-containing protein [Erysipelotrichaceae bacterium]|nr:DUF4153 domain-containing protein [Erysipelotrichaceae bacterium]
MKIRKFIEGRIRSFTESFMRFPVTVLMILAVAILNILLIHNVIDEIYPELLISFILSAETGLLLTLCQEKGLGISKLIANVSSVVVALISFLVLHFVDLEDYVVIACFGLILALFALILAVLYKDNSDKPLFGFLVQSGLYCGFTVAVGYVGIIICVLAFYYLVYSFDNLMELVLSLTDLAGAAFAIMLLSYVPDKDTRIIASKSYRNIFNKVGFSVYLLLIGVLYVYIGKIIITWQFPVGRLNWFGSLALLFYVLFYLNLTNEEGKIQKWFVRYGGLVLVPILAVQLYAIYIRVSAYGLTSLRYISLLLILFAVMFVINSVIRKNYSWMFVAGCVIALVSCIGPLNFIDLPNRNQEARMFEVINKYGLIENGQYHYKETVSAEDREILLGSYDYLKYSDGKKSDQVTMITQLDHDALVGNTSESGSHKYQWVSYYPQQIEADISNYQKAIYTVSYDCTNVNEVDLKGRMLEIYKKYGESPINDSILMVEIDENRAFLVQELSMEIIDESEIGYFYIEGYLLIGGE